MAAAFLTIITLFFIVKTFNEFQSGKFIGQGQIGINTIDVVGKGEVFAKPDIAEFSVTVEKNAISVNDAQNNATEAINKVTKFLTDSGIEDKDIKTTNYNIYPRYDYLRDQGQVFRGYTVSQTLDIKIRKIEDTGKILAGVTDAGANQVGGVNFKVDNDDAVLRQAREKAINDAKTKAEQLAKDLGVKIVRLINYSESGNGIYPYPLYGMESKMVGTGGDVAPSVPTGENTFTVNVSLTYQIK